MEALTIGKLAKACDVGVETVRYYQRRGLLEAPARGGTDGGIWRYGADDLRRLRFIRSAQAAGFTLEQIGELLAMHKTSDREQARALARTQIATLDNKIAEMTQARDALQKLARCCDDSSEGPCPILTAFDA